MEKITKVFGSIKTVTGSSGDKGSSQLVKNPVLRDVVRIGEENIVGCCSLERIERLCEV